MKLLMTGAAALSFCAMSVNAQTFAYNTRDLLLTFHRSGSSDMEVNLGNVDIFRNATVTMDLTPSYNVNSQLLGTFGTLNSLSFSIIGTQRGAGEQAANTSWMTLRRTDPAVPTSAPNGYTASKTQSIQSSISGIAGDGSASGALHYGSNHPADSVGNTANVVIIPTTGVDSIDSYTTKSTAVGGLNSQVTSPGVENTTSGTFSSTPGAVASSDLYEYAPGTSASAATLVGTFNLSNNGSLSFVPIPEPSTLATLSLGTIALFCVTRRRKF